MAHRRTNGQVEYVNEMILQGLKPQIFDRLVMHIHKLTKRWAADLPAIL